MTSQPTPTTPAGSTESRRKWFHFGIIAGLLLVLTVSWSVAMDALGIQLQKEPIPWPDRVEVKSTFQNVSFPERLGPYRLIGDGQWPFRSEKDGNDGIPDGMIEHRSDVLESLGIGSMLDKRRYEERMSNWYIARIYEDTREPRNSRYRYWNFSVEFYTGGEQTVPHVPDACVVQAGASIEKRMTVDLCLEDVPEPWREVSFVGVFYVKKENGRRSESVQYYIFDVNGEPITDRRMARLGLAKLSLKHIYYAKIQALPLSPIQNADEANRRAKEFMRRFLPAVLKELPGRDAVETYNNLN